MNDADARQILLSILEHAQEGKAHPFRPILYWSEYRYYLGWTRSTKIVIKTLKASADNLFTDYCQDVIAGISDFTKLLAYSELLDIIAFYENDLNTVQRMIDDYKDYLGNESFGTILNALFGGRRES